MEGGRSITIDRISGLGRGGATPVVCLSSEDSRGGEVRRVLFKKITLVNRSC